MNLDQNLVRLIPGLIGMKLHSKDHVLPVVPEVLFTLVNRPQTKLSRRCPALSPANAF